MAAPEERNLFSLHKIKSFLKAQKRTLFLAIYPRQCPLCHKILPTSKLICTACRNQLPYIKEPICYRCGKPVSSAEQEYCFDCRSFPKSFQTGLALFIYNETTRPVMADLKYHNKRILSDFFIQETILRYKKSLLSWNVQLIVPVPVHKNKKKSRGYNQAELLAKALSFQLSIPYLPDLLIRTIDTLPQKYFTAKNRHDNLLTAFSINTDYDLSGISSVLLIDDIYTTGATMEACTKILKSHGIAKVYIFSICIGLARD